ncbi:MAG: hypothetical protein MJ252_22195 [archaeon]|nr:hypothetical protein [archaeon]
MKDSEPSKEISLVKKTKNKKKKGIDFADFALDNGIKLNIQYEENKINFNKGNEKNNIFSILITENKAYKENKHLNKEIKEVENREMDYENNGNKRKEQKIEEKEDNSYQNYKSDTWYNKNKSNQPQGYKNYSNGYHNYYYKGNYNDHYKKYNNRSNDNHQIIYYQNDNINFKTNIHQTAIEIPNTIEDTIKLNKCIKKDNLQYNINLDIKANESNHENPSINKNLPNTNPTIEETSINNTSENNLTSDQLNKNKFDKSSYKMKSNGNSNVKFQNYDISQVNLNPYIPDVNFPVLDEDILHLLEFYISFKYLNMDSTLREQIDDKGWIPIKAFLSLKKFINMQIAECKIKDVLTKIGSDTIEIKDDEKDTYIRYNNFEKEKHKLLPLETVRKNKKNSLNENNEDSNSLLKRRYNQMNQYNQNIQAQQQMQYLLMMKKRMQMMQIHQYQMNNMTNNK